MGGGHEEKSPLPRVRELSGSFPGKLGESGGEQGGKQSTGEAESGGHQLQFGREANGQGRKQGNVPCVGCQHATLERRWLWW